MHVACTPTHKSCVIIIIVVNIVDIINLNARIKREFETVRNPPPKENMIMEQNQTLLNSFKCTLTACSFLNRNGRTVDLGERGGGEGN